MAAALHLQAKRKGLRSVGFLTQGFKQIISSDSSCLEKLEKCQKLIMESSCDLVDSLEAGRSRRIDRFRGLGGHGRGLFCLPGPVEPLYISAGRVVAAHTSPDFAQSHFGPSDPAQQIGDQPMRSAERCIFGQPRQLPLLK